MDFFIIANAWSAGKDNPTSKHRIALELVRQGHRVLWIEGSGMRTPSVGSSSDRLRMVRKVLASFRGARREGVRRIEPLTPALSRSGTAASPLTPALSRKGRGCRWRGCRWKGGGAASSPFRGEDRGEGVSLWVLSPLFIPLPKQALIRHLNGLICRLSMRFWGWRLEFQDPVLINYVPVLAEAMRGRRRRPQTTDYRPQTIDQRTPCEAGLPSLKSSVYGLKSMVSPRAPRVVYHCVDRWDAFAMYDSSLMGEMDRRCCQYADLVIASAGELYDRCRAINPNTVLIPHGVDWEHFRCAVTEMQTIDHRQQTIDQNAGSAQLKSNVYGLGSRVPLPHTIGFFGLLSEWVDQELILRLAKEFSPHDTPHLNPLPQGERKDGNQLHPLPLGETPHLNPLPQGERKDGNHLHPLHLHPRHLHPLHLHPLPLRERAGVRGEIDVPLRERAGVRGEIAVPLRERAGVRGSSSPHARILLIGKADVDVSRLQGIPNIELAGPIPFADLPAQVSTFTVGIIPFVVNDLTRSVNPIKLREMLSAGCPVVSTNLPEVARYAGNVQIAHNHDEFVAMVRRALENPLPPQDRLALSDSMAGETWTAKVQEILALLHENHS